MQGDASKYQVVGAYINNKLSHIVESSVARVTNIWVVRFMLLCCALVLIFLRNNMKLLNLALHKMIYKLALVLSMIKLTTVTMILIGQCCWRHYG